MDISNVTLIPYILKAKLKRVLNTNCFSQLTTTGSLPVLYVRGWTVLLAGKQN